MWNTSTLPAGSLLNCSTQWVRTTSTVSCFPVAGLVCAPTDSVNTTNANSNNHLLIQTSLKLRIYQTGILAASGNNALARHTNLPLAQCMSLLGCRSIRRGIFRALRKVYGMPRVEACLRDPEHVDFLLHAALAADMEHLDLSRWILLELRSPVSANGIRRVRLVMIRVELIRQRWVGGFSD